MLHAPTAPTAQAAPAEASAPDPPREPDSHFWTASPYVLLANPTASYDRMGFGGEFSLMRHPHANFESLFCFPACWGGLAQIESTPSVRSSSDRVMRLALAAQGAFGPFGAELGPALETTPSGGALLGAHAGAFFSVGFGSFGLRVSAYPGRFDEGDHGLEAAFVVRATLPVLLPLVYVPRTGAVDSAFFTRELGRFPM